METSKCKSCGWHLQPDKCQLFKIIVNPNEDFCSKHMRNILTCEICGQPAYKKTSVVDIEDDGTAHNFCKNCFAQLKTCRFCSHGDKCDFETNQSPLPKMIQQKIQQGPYQTVTTVMNPERVRLTCENGCNCFSKENGCLKQNYQTCHNHDYKYNKQEEKI